MFASTPSFCLSLESDLKTLFINLLYEIGVRVLLARYDNIQSRRTSSLRPHASVGVGTGGAAEGGSGGPLPVFDTWQRRVQEISKQTPNHVLLSVSFYSR